MSIWVHRRRYTYILTGVAAAIVLAWAPATAPAHADDPVTTDDGILTVLDEVLGGAPTTTPPPVPPAPVNLPG